MNTATISIETKTKTEAQKLAKKLGMNLSEVVEKYLKQFVQTKGTQIQSLDETPNAATIRSLKQSDADIKAGRTKSFATGQEALEYVRSLIKHDQDQQRKTH